MASSSAVSESLARVDPAWLPRWWPLAGAAFLVVATCVVYLPALEGDFILDDDLLLLNDLVKAPDGLYRMWFSTEAVDYWPVSNSTLWIEWRFWGRNPLGYHVTNLVLHLAASLLVWAALRELSIPGAFLAALLFAVHPVNVESVAWISQRKTLMATVFFLLSVLWYVKAEKRQSPGLWYWLSFAAYVLGMLSKASIATLPLVLLLITWFRRDRIERRDLVRVAPFFLITIPLVLVNLWFRTHGSGEELRLGGLSRAVVGSRRRALVLSLQGGAALEPDLYLPAVGDSAEQSVLVAAAVCLGRVVRGLDLAARAVVGSPRVVCLVVLLAGAVARAGLCRRVVYALVVGERSLSVHVDHGGRRAGGCGVLPHGLPMRRQRPSPWWELSQRRWSAC